MQYIERTLQVKNALLTRPDLLEKIRAIFASHVAKDSAYKPIGKGTSRYAYEVGTCEVAVGVEIMLLLKLKADVFYMDYKIASELLEQGESGELGAFEIYYDFVVGNIQEVSYREEGRGSFALNENWGGTRVSRGDIGAIPYFQLIVRHGEWFGQLTESEPSFFKPKWSADCWGTDDNDTVKHGRIIDLDRIQSELVKRDAGLCDSDDDYPHSLGVVIRGSKYFLPANRLDL